MKKISLLLLWAFLSLNFVFGQAPNSFKYQSVVRDASTGNPLLNKSVSFQINIIQDTTTGTTIYTETFTGIKTNAFGIATLDIGKGTAIHGTFNSINWGQHHYFIGVNLDATGGSTYVAMGTSELLSVPYALYAANGDQVVNLTGTGSTTISGTYPNFTINSTKLLAGNGILINSNDSINNIHTGDAVGSGSLTVVALQGNAISTTVPTTNQALRWNGSAWAPADVAENTYYAGTGLSLMGSTFIQNPHTGDVVGTDSLTVVALQGNAVSNMVPTTNQALIWNGSAWAPANITQNTYYAGTGMSLSGNTFINTSPNATHTGDALGASSLTVVALRGNAISTTVPTSNQVLAWNGTAWAPSSSSGGISGTGTTGYVTFWNGATSVTGNNNLFWDNTNKRLGIGTSSPTQQLELTGNLKLPVPTATAGTIYKGTIPFMHGYGLFNAFLGENAGNFTASPGWGFGNVGIGELALSVNNGWSNTGVGDSALYLNTSGYNNSAVGWGALSSNTTADDNTAVGNACLYANTTGSYNTAIGSFAMIMSATGSGNTVSGYETMPNNTTGSYNTISGYFALMGNSTGSFNTGSGSMVLYSNSTGYSNSAFGRYSLNKNSTGFKNAGYGDSTLLTNTTGSYNTGVGFFADISLGTLSNATAIGYGAVVNATNKVRIGNTAVTVIEGQVGWTSISDMRYKENIKDIGIGLEFVMKLRPVEYEMKTGDSRLNYGFIAQELLQLVGENNTLVNIGNDPDKTLSVRHTDLIAPIVKAIQEQQLKIKELESRLEKLENK